MVLVFSKGRVSEGQDQVLHVCTTPQQGGIPSTAAVTHHQVVAYRPRTLLLRHHSKTRVGSRLVRFVVVWHRPRWKEELSSVESCSVPLTRSHQKSRDQ